MAEHLSKDDVKVIAEYTRIGLEEGEVEQLTHELNDIIESLKPITEYNLEGVEPTSHPIGTLCNVMRNDVQAKSLTQEEALMNATKKEDGCFLIPSILGGGGE